MRALGRLAPLAGLVLAAGLACGPGGRAKPVTHVVAMSGIAFVPPVTQLAVGDTVVFRNDDPVPHTATADQGSFNSGDVQPGKSWRWVARQKGRLAYHCTYHPNMTGTLVVR